MHKNPPPETVKTTLAGYAALYDCSSDDAGDDASQTARNEAFLAAVRDGRSDIARALASAPPPDDATDAELERWKTRRRLYRRRTTASRT